MDEIPKTIPIRDRDDPFLIEELIGEGGMGKVYRARDPVTGELLAVKVLAESAGDPTRFALESDILSKLHHPNIVAYKGHGLTKDGHPYLAMEWVEGTDLEKQLEEGTFTVEATLDIARAVADALASAHAAGVIHRDLKPSNVITNYQKVKLVDFGIARAANVDGLTKTGQAVGTPGYMSPEQARGHAVDARSDLFSLGCLIFRCVGGRRPFAGSDIMQFATSLALENPPLLREIAPRVPRELETLVAQLLQKDPALRPESALHVKQAIDRIAAGTDKTALAPTAAGPAAPTLPGHGGGANTRAKSDPALDRTELAPSVAVTRKSKDLEEPLPPRNRAYLTVTFGIAMVLGIGLLVKDKLGHGDDATHVPPGPVPVASVPSAMPLPSAGPGPGPGPGPNPVSSPLAERAALDRACKKWATAIARGQRANGAFAGEERAQPSGWDTAQQLFALAEAKRACDGATPAMLGAGVRALDELHIEGGWLGPRAGTVPPKERVGEASASAWALLALTQIGDAKAAERAKKDLLAARNADGGFRGEPARKADSALYPTVLAAAALGKSPEGEAARDWLAKAVEREAFGTRELGSTEQLAWVYQRGRGAEKDLALRKLFATETIAHCRPDADGACSRAPYETGRSPLLADGGAPLIALWHPWATLAAATLAKDPDLAAQKGDLETVARWGTKELTTSIDTLGAAPAYKLAEYLIVVSELLDPSRP